MAKTTCTVAGCEKQAERREWCTAHYKRWKRHGDPLAGRVMVQPGTPVERFWGKVNRNGPTPGHRPDLGPCWLWTGYLGERGYGTYTFDGVWVNTHRAAYELTIAPIPDGLQLDHLCRNPPCCNPGHLEPVTGAENMRRTRRTRCNRGHKLDPSNEEDRRCRECAKLHEAARPSRWPAPPPNLLTTRQAADEMGVPVHRIKTWGQEGLITDRGTRGKSLWDRNEVESAPTRRTRGRKVAA